MTNTVNTKKITFLKDLSNDEVVELVENNEKLMNDLKQDLINDEEEDTFTNNIDEAIFILNDGSLASGEFYDGIRNLDHNSIKSRFEPETSWKQLHDTYNFIRLVPETKTALISGSQVVSENIQNMLNSSSYEIEAYC